MVFHQLNAYNIKNNYLLFQTSLLLFSHMQSWKYSGREIL
jgi:hypothetical protein